MSYLGLFSKPYSPLILALISYLKGEEAGAGDDMYGGPPGGHPGYYWEYRYWILIYDSNNIKRRLILYEQIY